MNKKEGITEAHVFHGLIRICVQRGENWLCFSSLKKHSLICPRQRLNSYRSSEPEVDKGYPQNCIGVLPLAHPEPKAWEIQVGLIFSQWG